MGGRIAGVGDPRTRVTLYNRKPVPHNKVKSYNERTHLKLQAYSLPSFSEARDPYTAKTALGAPLKITAPGFSIIQKLPVFKCLHKIGRAVAENDVIGIVSDTGSGKTLLVPKSLIEAGIVKRVFCCEPTQVAARAAAETVSKMCGTVLGEEVGYCHRGSAVRGAETKIIYVTNGYQFAADAANDFRYKEGDAIVFDEAHIETVSMEFQLAFIDRLRERAKKDPTIVVPKIIFMSATINLDHQKKFFGQDFPIVEIKGRVFPIEVIEKKAPLVKEAMSWLAQGKSVMTLVPGKIEADSATAAEVEAGKRLGLDFEAMPIYSRMLKEEQDRAINFEGKKAVNATNIATTSLTIKGIDVVISLDLVRNMHLIGRVPTLITEHCSKRERDQGAGRISRTKPGIFVSVSGVAYKDLKDKPDPHIYSSDFSGELLGVLSMPNMTFKSVQRLRLPNQISDGRWRDTLKRLQDLGFASPQGNISQDPNSHGRRAANLPLEIGLRKMVLVAEDFARQTGDDNILRRVVDVVAARQVEGILIPKSKKFWKKFLDTDPRSDLLAEGIILNKALSLPVAELKENGISAATFYRARKLQSELYQRLRIKVPHDAPIIIESGSKAEELVNKAIFSGKSDSVYIKVSGAFSGGRPLYRALNNKADKELRTLPLDSILSAEPPEIVVGDPFSYRDSFTQTNPLVVNTICFPSAVSAKDAIAHFGETRDRYLDSLRYKEAKARMEEELDFIVPPKHRRGEKGSWPIKQKGNRRQK